MKYSEQQANLGFFTPEAKTGSSTLALLFLTMGALHIYGIMRSSSRRILLTENSTIIFNPSVSRYVTICLVAIAMALGVEILVF